MRDPPEEVYELAKRRGMDFVTITDHDTIDGVTLIADRPDVFISEELTVWFADQPQAVHVLCLGITPDDHEWLQAHNHDVERCAEYLSENGIVAALAHPFYAVEAPLTSAHRRRLAELFGIWETRNGSRARELNMPAAIYVDTHGGTGVAGSDDHAGVDIGRTYTETPGARTPEEFLRHVAAGAATACGDQGSAAKWAHAGIALAVRALGDGPAPPPDPASVWRMVERVLREGAARHGALGADLQPGDARALLRAWLDALDLGLGAGELIEHMQSDEFSHAQLERRARRIHERRLRSAVEGGVQAVQGGAAPAAVALGVFDACLPVIPYAPSAAFLGREKAGLVRRDADGPRVALIADGIGTVHGVSRTIAQIRERGVPGFEVDVLGTDASVDRRLPAVADLEVPFDDGLSMGVPSLPGLVEALAEGRYDAVHVCAPGPAGAAAALLAKASQIPVVGSYHTELSTYAPVADGQRGGRADRGISPSRSADASLHGLGIKSKRIARWDRGVDVSRFDPGLREPGLLPGEINVMYAGRLTREKGVDLLAEAFLHARREDERLHLVVAGGGPELEWLRVRLGNAVTFLGWLDGEELGRAYASADVFLFPSPTDTFGQVVLEAQASGLPVVAADAGGPAGRRT